MKLTDRKKSLLGAEASDLIHIVKTGDTSQNSSGSSYKIEMNEYSGILNDNYVRYLSININDLPNNYVKQDICDYVLNLPIEEKTIASTDSKWNIIIIENDLVSINKIYEIQNIGKGEIISIQPDNLLLFYEIVNNSNNYVRGWEIERELGNSITIGKGLGKITLTNGSSSIIGIDGVDFTNQTNLDSPFFLYQMTIILPDNSRRYVSLLSFSDSTNGELSEIYSDNQYDISLGTTWTGETGNYEYFPYFIPEASGIFSHAEGNQTIASGTSSHAEGQNTIAGGQYSHAEGYRTIASDESSHAEGSRATAIGQASHAEGSQTIASGFTSHAEGSGTQAIGDYSHAEGYQSTASASYSHAQGGQTTASGDFSHAEGAYTIASGQFSHTEGAYTTGSGDYSHAEGNSTTSNGQYSHAGGVTSQANGIASFVHGSGSTANGNNSIVLGRNITGNTADTTYVDNLNIKTLAVGTSVNNLGIDANGRVIVGSIGGGTGSTGPDTYVTGGTYNTGTAVFTNNTGGTFNVSGFKTSDLVVTGGTYNAGTAVFTNSTGGTFNVSGWRFSGGTGVNSQASVNGNNIAFGDYSTATGSGTSANGFASFTTGRNTIAGSYAAHAEGLDTQANGSGSHSEGSFTIANGVSSHSEGAYTIATGNRSHAEGSGSTAIGDSSHAEGIGTIASGTSSHAGGATSQANGINSFVHGSGSMANGDNSVVLGANITGNTANTTYVDNFNIKTITSGTSVNNLGIDINGNVIASDNLQKTITSTYNLSNSDNNYTILINNSTTPINIVIPTNLVGKINVGFIQQGTGDVTITGASTTINTPISGAFKIKGQNYNAYIEQIGSTNVYHLLGNLKV